MGKKQVVSITPVNDYITIQPALDFFDDKAILSVGAKWLYSYDNGDIKFETHPYCIISNGDKFGYSKREYSLSSAKSIYSSILFLTSSKTSLKVLLFGSWLKFSMSSKLHLVSGISIAPT